MRAQFVVRKKQKKRERLVSILSLKSLFQGTSPDVGLLLSVFGLIVFGWVMVYSSSAIFAENRFHDQYYFLKKQVMWSLIGSAAFLMSANMPLSFIQRNVRPLFIGTIAALVMVLFVGKQIYGAQRWLNFGPISFQPSELAKVVMVFLVADYLDRRQSRMRDFKKGMVPLLAMTGLMTGLILIEPDLGTPVLMAMVFVSLLVLGGARWLHLILLGASLLPVIALAVFKVRYRMDRILAYLNPWSDPMGTGYQLVQSLLALGSGGFFGRGLGESRIKISNLPEAHTDFVFSVLGEELGLLGTLLCAGLFLFLCIRGLRIAMEAKSFFSRLTAAGISLTIGFQAVINMGVACGLLPTKGMPLPFLSFGGSSLVIMMISIGILANVSRESKRAATEEV
jgi:cell division protein FtsW